MNDFKKIVPKKQEKKRATSVKRNNSLIEDNKKKNSMNTERYYTTYEVFEKLNTKLNKKQKLRANSSSKKKKKSKNKNYLSLEHSKKKNNIDNIFTNNTHFTTLETDNNKNKIKKSPKKEEFSKILTKAKELLSIQSDILIQCGKLNKNISKNNIEIEAKLKNETNKNGTNVLPGLAKALYLLEFKKENNDQKNINFKNYNSNINITNIEIEEDTIDISFYIKKFNELNGFIGELGYSYVYNEFDNDNYKKENLIIYFDNIEKLINMLHQTVNNQNEILIKQENKIKELENIIINYQKTINEYEYDYMLNKEGNIHNKNNKFDTNSISITRRSLKKEENKENNIIDNTIKSNKSNNSHILIKENISVNNINEIKDINDINEKNNMEHYNNEIYSNSNTNTNNIYNITNSQEFKIEECNNIFKNNINNNSNNIQKEIPKNTHYYNSYINQSFFSIKDKESKNYNENDDLNKVNNINENSIDNYVNNYNKYKDKKEKENNVKKQYLPPEMSNNYLNYYNNNKNVISSMIDSGSFFESYKRNKELKHNLNYNYNERSLNNE